MTKARGWFALLSLLTVLAGCASGTSTTATPRAVRSASTPHPTVTTTATRLATHSARPTAARKPTAAPTAASRRRLLVERLSGVGNARQVVAVTARRYRTSYATLTTYTHTSQGWRKVFGPWSVRIGYDGFAPPGRKREGDGRTPTGSFGFQFMFGVMANPGVRFSYRRALTTSRWDDDPKSRHYNEWVDSRTAYPGRKPEAMRQTPAYRYGAVIGYNTTRTPGLGSAIFLHVAHKGPTSGCVSLPQPRLLAVLRWLDPAQAPRIVMGTTSSVVQ